MKKLLISISIFSALLVSTSILTSFIMEDAHAKKDKIKKPKKAKHGGGGGTPEPLSLALIAIGGGAIALRKFSKKD